jgi:hypothetical protein
VHWQPREPPLIVVDATFVPGRWRPSGGPALRRFDLDPGTARFFGYSVEQAAAVPDSHYDGDTRARGSGPGARGGSSTWRSGGARTAKPRLGRAPASWRAGRSLLQRHRRTARTRHRTPRAERVPGLGREPDRSSPCPPGLSRRQRRLPAGRGKVRVVLVSQDGDEYKFERGLGRADEPTRPPAARPPSS